MKKEDKLHAYWSKRERDIMLAYPLGISTSSDGHFLSGIFNREFEREMESRGYDITTLKFSIEPKAGNPRFASQRTEPKKDGTE